MSKLVKGNQRHMSLDDRIYIEKSLEKSMHFKDIAMFLSKDPTTISKEIKKHRVLKPRNTLYIPNNCKFRQNCKLTNICIPCTSFSFKNRCATCSNCNKYCPKYIPNECINLSRAPFVCNGCDKKNNCRLEKYYYRAATAHSKYRTILSTSREGINLSEYALSDLDNLVSPLIKLGQPITHIFESNSNAIPCAKRTLYNYIQNNVLTVRNIDLPRKVKYKPRKQHIKKQRDYSWREGRKYSDFLSFLEEHPETSVVEMDTVEGVKGGKVLLTMLFRNSRCMLAFLLPCKTQEAVLDVFNSLEEAISTLVFQKNFPVFLTDNGSEFINPILLETGMNSYARTRIYYCDPNASYQKGSLEKNHEFIRYIVPKGKAFDNFTQDDITLLVNQINSTARASLNGRTPFELASLLLDKCVIDVLGIKEIRPNEVVLKPNLLKK